MTGTVFDIGYRNYTGDREGQKRGRRAVFKDGVRTALGLGRGPRAKILPWLFIGILSAIALVMAMVAGTVDRLAGAGAARQMELPSHGDYYGIAASLVFVFGAIVAPELLCRDRREGVINLYLVRPLTGSDYVISRWSAFFVVMLAAVWLPQFILFAGLAGGDAAPVTYFLAHWVDIPRFLLAGLAMTVFVTSLALLTASFTTRRAYAAVFLVGLFVISTPFTVGMSQEIGGKAGQWISMFTLSNIPLHVNDLIFGEFSDITDDAPARLMPAALLVGWYFAWTIIPSVVLWWRYRRLSP